MSRIISPGVFLWISILPFFMAHPVFSKTPADDVILDTVVVTAEKMDDTFQTGDVDKNQTPAFYSVITRDQFEGKMTDLAEVIEKEVGIQVRQTGGFGSFSTVSLRGSTSEQVMIYLDGVLLNDASGGGVDLSNISLSDVESVEVYRGTSPINFSRSSVGGVVNIKTLRSKKGLQGNVNVGIGSFNTKKASAFVNHKPGKWDYLVSAEAMTSDNDFEFLNDNGTQWNKEDDRTEKRNNADIEQKNILAKVGYDLADSVRVDFVNQWFSKYQGLPSWNNSESTQTSFDTDRNIFTAKFTADDLTPYHINTSTTFDHSWKREEYKDTAGEIGLGQQHNVYTTTRYGGNFFAELITDYHVLSLTLDTDVEYYDTEDKLDRQNPNDSSRTTYAAGLQDSLILFQNRLIITPAIRYTLIEDELKSATGTEGQALQGKDTTESYVSPQMGIRYHPFENFILKTNLSQYTREPSFFELFGDRGFISGNEDLKAETGTNFDIGFEINMSTGSDVMKRVNVYTTYFYSDVEDLITITYDSRGIGKYENVSSSIIKGMESGMTFDFWKYLRFISNVTFLDTENQSDIDMFDGKKLPGRYHQSYLLRLESFYQNLKAYYEVTIGKNMYYDTVNLLKAEDKCETNAGISYLFDPFQLSLDLKNIEDNQYEDFNGYPLPGRSIFINLKYSF